MTASSVIVPGHRLVWALAWALALSVGCDDGDPSAGAADQGGARDGLWVPDAAPALPDMQVMDLAVPGSHRDGGPMLCSDDTDCPDDERCAPTGECVYGCRPGGCAEGQVCAAGVCTNPPCQGDETCPEGTYCATGQCEVGCRRDPDDCAPGQRCDAQNRCVPNCDRPEICGNLEDEDCDGQIDDPDVCEVPPEETCAVDAGCETEGLGPCRPGRVACPEGAFGAPVCVALEAPADERCDGADNDCDGAVDEAFELGADCVIGEGACQADGRIGCAPDGAGTACLADGAAPGGEICDGEDDDCDGRVDEDFLGLGDACSAGDGVCRALGVLRCGEDGDAVVCDAEPGQGTIEHCNGLDDDCDGQIDEGFDGVGAPCEVGVGACRVRAVQICTPDGEGLRCAAVPGRPSAETCDRLDNDCDGETDEGPGGEALARACYTGPDATEGVGACSGGDQTCVAGVWSRCEGQTIPFPEVCDGSDRDCDGATDEGIDGGPYTEPCYDGPLGTAGQGICQAGVRVCLNGALGACAGSVLPQHEICDGADNDCDGLPDNVGEAGCACEGGAERACYSGAPGTEGVGACRAGTQTCTEDGAGFGVCADEVVPHPEACNGLDDDCDGRVDERLAAVDGPCTVGRGGCATQGVFVCDGEAGLRCDAVLVEPGDEICNGLDDDCDGTLDEGLGRGERCTAGVGACAREGVTVCVGDGAAGCSEAPGDPSDEICDGVDNDCDGAVDEGLGLGERCAAGQDACRVEGLTVCAPDGQVVCGAQAQAATPEICDAVDNDCDGAMDEGLGLGEPCNVGDGLCLRQGVRACGPDGEVRCFGGAADGVEVCNGLDDDCDGRADEGNPGAGEACDTGAPGRCAVGEASCFQGELQCFVTSQPVGEVCDGRDQDCDGVADEDFGGGEPCTAGVGACQRVGRRVCTGAGDLICDTEAASPLEEVCNGLDDDCDGRIDEAAPRAGALCALGQGACAAMGRVVCADGALGCDAEVIEPVEERCNATDDDCDGATDEGFPVGQRCVAGQGVCAAEGVFRCVADAAACDAEPTAAGDEVCNGLDDDCDGRPDEGGVCPDLEGPVVTLRIEPPLTDPGVEVTITALAEDAMGEVVDLVVRVDGELVALDDLGQITITPQAPGRVPVRVEATDDSDNTTLVDDAVRVRAPDDFERPDVRILSPADTTELTEPIEIRARLQDAHFDRYVLEIGPDGHTWETLAEGSAEGPDVAVGVLDPTLLAPGFVFVKLTGYDLNGNTLFHQVAYAVPEGISVGESKITIRDFTVPVKGIPIVLDRGYDSRRRLEVGDFGYGWRLTREDVTVVEDLQSNVMVALPDGRREVFAIRYEINPILPVGTLAYVPPAGVTSTLETGDSCLVTNTAHGVVCMFSGRSPAQTIHTYVLTTRDGLTYEMHDEDGLRRVTDREGNQLEFSDARITSSAGPTFEFERDDAGRVTTVTDPNGNQMRYRYDANGDLVEAEDPVGGVQRFAYDDAHRLLRVVGPDGNPVVRTEYDAEGRKLSETDALGHAVTYLHDQDGRREVVTDRRGETITYEYAADGKVLRRTDELGNTQTYDYDEETGWLMGETDVAGHHTAYGYDEYGNQITVTQPDGQVVTFDYDDFGQVTLMTNAAGATNELLYDEQGRLAGVRNAAGDEIAFEYDANGNRAASLAADGARTEYAYDALGNITHLDGPDGFSRGYAYDAMGNVTEITDAVGDGITLAYDAAGRVVGLTDGAGGEHTFERDGLGRMAAVTLPDGATTRFRYDVRGLLDRVTDANGHTTNYRYGPEGDLVATADALGGETTYARDAGGRITERTDPLGQVGRYTYDALGRLTLRTDRAGRETRFEYDAGGRLVAQHAGDAHLGFAFDPAGRLSAATAADGAETRYAWDGDGRLLEVQHPGGVRVAYDLDAEGRRIAVDAPGGLVRYDYDGRGRLTAVTDPAGRTVALDRDPEGRLVRQGLPGGVETTYSYDGAGRPTGWLTTRLGVPLDGETLTLDAAGRTVRVERFGGLVTELAYDAAGQLVRSIRSDSGGVLAEVAYAYDARGGRISRAVIGGGVEANTLDADQRLLDDAHWIYTYDAEGSLVARAAQDASAQETFDYDSERRLIGWTRTEGDAVVRRVTWHRDAFGAVVGRRVDGTLVRRYAQDAAERAFEFDGEGALVARHVHGDQIDQVLSTHQASGDRYYVLDARGNVAATYDAAGEQRGRMHYDDFGAVFDREGEVPAFGFAGRPTDADTGLVDMRARVVDPHTGRFLQQDPLAGRTQHPLTQHPYVYAMNNPYLYRDPSGRTAAISYALKLGQIFGLSGGADAPNHYEMMGSLIGFFHGFGSTGLVFLANILEIASSGGDVLGGWGAAIDRTQAKMDEIAGVLGRFSAIDESGFQGGFVDGAGWKVGIKISVTLVPDPVDRALTLLGEESPNMSEEIAIEKSVGGFKSGVSNFIDYLRAIAPR